MSFTFVTALYNISREQHDNRSYIQYQEWFKRTLTIPVPMVIYTEICNEDIVCKYRQGLPTKVIYTDLKDVPFMFTRDTVEHIIKNTDFKNKIKHPNGLEYRCFEYIPLVNSKFVWMANSIQNNYFNTEMFFWIDAGLSRFLDFDISNGIYNYDLIKKIQNENKIFIQIGKQPDFEMLLRGKLTFDFAVGKCINFMMAGFWGGNKDLILDICNKGSKMYIEEYINKQCVDNEQVIFGFILNDYKNNLLLVPNKIRDYYNYYIFCNKM